MILREELTVIPADNFVNLGFWRKTQEKKDKKTKPREKLNNIFPTHAPLH